MKSIISPYDDNNFNQYLLKYIKKYLRKKCEIFDKDDDEIKYTLDENSEKYYTYKDIINSLKLNNRLIYFSNRALVNHAVYDLSQRFWYDALKHTNNIIYKLFLKYKRITDNETYSSDIKRQNSSQIKRNSYGINND